MKTWSKFYDFIMPDLPGMPPSNLVDQKLRDAAIQLCSEGRVHRNTIDLMDVVAGQSEYDLDTDDPNNLEVFEVREVWVGELRLQPKTPHQLNHRYSQFWQNVAGTPIYYLCRDPHVLTLVPVPDTDVANGLRVEAVFSPTLEAKGVSDWVYDQYATAIVCGVKSMLMSMSRKPWTDLKMAAFYDAKFQSVIEEESFRAQRGFGRAIRTTCTHFF